MKVVPWTICLAGLLAFTSCSKKKIENTGQPTLPETAPAQPVDAAPPPPPPTAPAAAIDAPAPAADASGPEPTLAMVRQALDLWTFRRNDIPNDLNDLVTQGFLKRLPTPPPGKKFVYDRKNMAVHLVDQ